jgi:Insertion element 4 transposase N-terminal
MARTKAALGPGARLSDFLSATLLPRMFAPELVRQVLDEHDVNIQRAGSFPAVAVAYCCMALSLYPEAAHADVFAVAAQGWTLTQGRQAVPALAKSAISAARGKIGFEPMQSLHERACVPLADPIRQAEAFYAGFRLVAVDGSHFEVPAIASTLLRCAAARGDQPALLQQPWAPESPQGQSAPLAVSSARAHPVAWTQGGLRAYPAISSCAFSGTKVGEGFLK